MFSIAIWYISSTFVLVVWLFVLESSIQDKVLMCGTWVHHNFTHRQRCPCTPECTTNLREEKTENFVSKQKFQQRYSDASYQSNDILLLTHRSLRASFFKSEKSGMEFLNSFIFSSRIWHKARALTSRGSLLSCLMKPSMPSDKTDTSRLAHRVLAHSSRAACNVKRKYLMNA